MQKTLQVSLSRAHKIAERLKEHAQEHQREAARLAASTSVTGVAGEAQLARLRAQSSQSLERLALADQYWGALAQVRAAIGAENEKRGINAMLAELDATQKRVAVRKDLLSRADDSAMPLSELATYQPLNAESRLYGGVTVRMLDEAATAQVRQELKDLQRQAVALSDQIASANAGSLSLSLPIAVAEDVAG